MRKSILYIIFIFLFGIVISIVADYLLQKGFEKSNDDIIGKLNEIINDSTYYDAVCFGSSRALAHFNPEIIRNKLDMTAFNAGVNGACIIDINLLVKAYLLHRKPPKVIVIHIDDFTLETDRLKELPRYFPYIDNEIVYNNLKPFNETVTYIHAVHFLRIMFYFDLLKWVSIKSWFGIDPRNEYKLINGYRINKSQWNEHLEEGLKKRIEIIKELHTKPDVEKPGIQLLIELLDICKEKNINIVFTSSPLVSGSLDKLYSNTTKHIEKLSSSYDASYLWMHSLNWDRKVYFYDYLHMNSKGADKFSNELADHIQNSFYKNQ